jgi:hypothetical protein
MEEKYGQDAKMISHDLSVCQEQQLQQRLSRPPFTFQWDGRY